MRGGGLLFWQSFPFLQQQQQQHDAHNPFSAISWRGSKRTNSGRGSKHRDVERDGPSVRRIRERE